MERTLDYGSGSESSNLSRASNFLNMKTVLYRIQSIDATEDEGFIYGKMRVFSDAKITEEDCLRNEFGNFYVNNVPDTWICEIIKEIDDYDV